MPIFGQNASLMFPIFLKRSLVFPLLFFSSSFMHCSLKKAFLSLPAFFWNSAFNWMCLSLSPLLFTSLHSSATCKASSDNHFAFGWLSLLQALLWTSCLTCAEASGSCWGFWELWFYSKIWGNKQQFAFTWDKYEVGSRISSASLTFNYVTSVTCQAYWGPLASKPLLTSGALLGKSIGTASMEPFILILPLLPRLPARLG